MPPRLQPPSGPFPSTFTSPSPRRQFSTSSSRAAQLIRRPHRPYQFTQLLTLSDGSTTLHRTTSPLPVYRSTRDTRNTPLWNPSNAKMANVEEDEAGRLAAFRKKFGRGWDAKSAESEEALAGAADAVEDAAAAAGSAASAGPASGSGTPGGAADGAGGGVEAAAARGQGQGQRRAGKGTDAAGRGRKADEAKDDAGWGAEEEDNLMDLISAAGLAGAQHKGPVAAPQKVKAGKGRKK